MKQKETAGELDQSTRKTGVISSWLLAGLTLVTFILAMLAIPPSGPNCQSNCMTYPFTGLLTYFSRDYFWMYAACVQICVYIVFIIAFHQSALPGKKIFTTIATAFAIMSAVILLIDYFVQFSVIPISVLQGEHEGVGILTQYNGHGVFIAMEELGFSLMSVSFFFLSLGIPSNTRLEKTLRVVLGLPLFLCLLAFLFYSIQFGIDRNYRYEVAAITINWLTAMAAGILAGISFPRMR